MQAFRFLSNYYPCLLLIAWILNLYSGTAIATEQRFSHETSVMSYQLGYRNDQLDWNIASDPSGTFTPNILSELTWQEVESVQLTVDFSGLISELLFYRVNVAVASIRKGQNQDSDYNGNDRTLEFSRSNNNASSGTLSDFSGAIGIPFTFGDNAATLLRVTPLIGYSYHSQKFSMTDGVQTIATSGITPDLGPFPGLNSSYEAEWYGPWLGIELKLGITQNVEVSLVLEHHEGDYLGIGNWNLRSDFQHPKSFEHVADASGDLVSLNLAIVSDYAWNWLFSIQFQSWQADSGIDTVFFSDNTVGVTRLNEVNWQAITVSLGFEIPF